LLGRLESDEALEPLHHALKDPDPKCRIEALRILGEKGRRRSLSAIRAAVHDEDPGVQRAAIQALGNFKQQEAISTLLKLVQEGKEQTKLLAVQALDRISTPQAIYELFRCLGTGSPDLERISKKALLRIFRSRPVDVRETLLRILKEEDDAVGMAVFHFLDDVGNPRYFERIIEECATEPPGIRQKLARIFSELDSEIALVSTLKVLDKGDEGAKLLALEILAHLRDPRTVKALCRKFHDAEWWFQEAIVETLGEIGAPGAVPTLLEALKGEDLHWPVLIALGKIKDPRGIVPILRVLASHPSIRVKIAALEALKAFREPRILERILPLLKSPDKQLRQKAQEVIAAISPKLIERQNVEAATRIIRELGMPREPAPDTFRSRLQRLTGDFDFEIAEALLPLVFGNDSEDLVTAMRFLDRWENETATLSFIERVAAEGAGVLDRFTAVLRSGYGRFFLAVAIEKGPTHRNREVQLFSIELIKRLECKEAVAHLLPLLDHPDWWIKSQAIEVLGLLRAGEAVGPLVRMLDDPDARWATFEALARIGDGSCAPAIAECLNDPRRPIRIGALEALRTLRNPEVLPKIQEYLEDPEVLVREHAEAAIQAILQSQATCTRKEIATLVRDACGVHLLKREQAIEKLRKLSQHHALDLIDPLLTLVMEENPSLCKRVIRFLDTWGDPVRIAEFLDSVKELDYATIMRVIDGISQERGTFFVATLLDLIYGREEKFKGRYNIFLNRFAIEVAKQMRLAEAVPVLRELSQAEEWDVREVAILALGHIGNAEAMAALGALIEEGRSRWTVAEALGIARRREAVPLLLELLDVEDRNVRKSALESLKQIRDRTAMEKVRTFLGHDDALLRDTAEEVLMVLEDV
ncbi:MAG: HEAT repeat domain-containing protein, partial [Deltaproteobacteria bacterium]